MMRNLSPARTSSDRVDRMQRLGQTLARARALPASILQRCGAGGVCVACGREAHVPALLATRAQHLVRDLNGLIGAAALSRAVVGRSRREAARLKCTTLTLIERERQRTLTRISVAAVGDPRAHAMHLSIDGAKSYALVCADAAIPYRTPSRSGEHYDAALVARTLERDIDTHGAPFILRADRARAHDPPLVKKILEEHQVLMLHGPRAIRASTASSNGKTVNIAPGSPRSPIRWGPMQALLERMIYCLNTLWPRRSMAGRPQRKRGMTAPTSTSIVMGSRRSKTALDTSSAISICVPSPQSHRTSSHRADARKSGYLHRQQGGWC